jgi:transcriptional regulator with XRE-family HTH domain
MRYVSPSSPFQKLIDAARVKQRLSGRELAAKIVVDGKPLSQSTLWIWLHSENGFPHPKAFKREHLRQLGRALRIPEQQIKDAIDASRLLYNSRENPMPRKTFDAFSHYIDILEHDSRRMISRGYVLNLAKTLYNGAVAAYDH